jgi:hypothetical protein
MFASVQPCRDRSALKSLNGISCRPKRQSANGRKFRCPFSTLNGRDPLSGCSRRSGVSLAALRVVSKEPASPASPFRPYLFPAFTQHCGLALKHTSAQAQIYASARSQPGNKPFCASQELDTPNGAPASKWHASFECVQKSLSNSWQRGDGDPSLAPSRFFICRLCKRHLFQPQDDLV